MRFPSVILGAALLLTGAAAVVSTLGVPIAAAQVSATASVTPGQPTFTAGAPAMFKGRGFSPGEQVTFEVTHVRGTPATGGNHNPATVLTDPNGGFVATWLVCAGDCVGELLQIEATGQTSGKVARAVFIDLSPPPQQGSQAQQFHAGGAADRRADQAWANPTQTASVPTFERIKSLGMPGVGGYPWAGLLQGTDGMLYGTSTSGGTAGYGTVFKLSPDGTGFTVLKSFDYSTTGASPNGRLVQGTDGALYGTANYGGPSSYGTVFKLNTDGTGFTVLQNFDYSTTGGNLYAGLVQGTDGALYGTTYQGGTNGVGAVFKLNTNGTGFTVLLNFDYFTTGGYLYGGLVQGTDGALYGTAYQGGANGNGTVFKLNTNGTGFTVLQDLDYSTTGVNPFAGLLQGTDGALYGTASNGGSMGSGTAFKLNTNGTGFTVLQNFDYSTSGGNPYGGLVQGTDGALYGTALLGGASGYGTAFKLNTDGTGFTVLKNFDYSTTGGFVVAGLVQGTDGALYGTAYQGGTNNVGTVFKLNTDGTAFAVLKDLSIGADLSTTGAYLYSGLMQGTDGALYGMAYQGGTIGYGTVFKLNTDGTGFTVLQNFDHSTTGGYPYGTWLVQGTDGTLYGTASQGGTSGYGTVFKLNTDGTGFTVLKNLDYSTTGGYLYSGLVLGTDGTLYGTASQGGSIGYGTVFKLNTDGTGFSVLKSFDYFTSGGHLYSGLMQGTDGALYGTAYQGGANGTGTVFKLNTDGNGFTVLQNLDNSTGAYPYASRLVQGTDGALYGTASQGGTGFVGTVFKLNTNGTGFTVLQNFDYSTTGAYLYGGLVQGADGALYGTASQGGASGFGTLFQLNTDGSDFSVLKNFDGGADGAYFFGMTLAKGTDGNLYGAATQGGDAGFGTIFRLVFTSANNPPVATITGPASGSVFAVDTAVPFTGTWTDPDGGAHTAQWTFDGVPAASFAAGTGTSGSANTSHTFADAGVYMVQLAVMDDAGGADTANQIGDADAMVVIYDPSAGFVTGGGWINSPAGAYPADSALTGRANFGFVSKYRRGASIPTGETEFRYSVGNLNFHSTSYQWLVVSGARAQYKGSGTINGAGNYGFMLTAVDGQISGGGGQDKFRIKITDPDGVVYDNMLNAADSAVPTTVLGGGSIVIHTGGPGSAAAELPREEVTATVPAEYDLSQNYPNPFERSTQIGFALPERSRVSLAVYDLAGRAVRVLTEGEWAAGRHSATLNRTGDDGRRLGAGVYWVRMNAVSMASGQTFHSLRKVVLVK